LIEIDRLSRVSIFEQVIEQAEKLILSGAWKEGEMIPSVREMATQLSINPNTLQKAFTELERRGICYSVPGIGRFITQNALSLLHAGKLESLQALGQMAEMLAQSGIPLDIVLSTVKDGYMAALHNANNKEESNHD